MSKKKKKADNYYICSQRRLSNYLGQILLQSVFNRTNEIDVLFTRWFFSSSEIKIDLILTRK